MRIKNRIHRLKIEFNVTPEIRRFVYIYLIEGQHLYLIDAGVDGAEKTISEYLESIGRHMKEIKALLLTHSHPDHIGAAQNICQASGCRVYACAGEREWIENIDRQFKDRPIPNFFRLVNQSVAITDVVRGGDTLHPEDGITIQVINAGGHSPESLAYLFCEEQTLFTGDAIPLVGELPIHISAEDSLKTLDRLSHLQEAELYLSAWDEPMNKLSYAQSKNEVSAMLLRIDKTARDIALSFPELEIEDQFRTICEELGVEKSAGNPLFRASVLSSLPQKDTERCQTMPNGYKIINPETWKRNAYCEIYKKAVQPQYCVSFDLDVTHFRQSVRARGLSFTMAFIYCVASCANEIEEFRYRFLNGQAVLYESADTSFTYMDSETELFKVVNVPMRDSIEEFVQLARETAEKQKVPFTGPVPNNVYQFSALPWIAFKHVSHTDFGDPEKAQPIFDWGKFIQVGEKWTMPFAVQVHHGFVDGVHIGKLAYSLQICLDKLQSVEKSVARFGLHPRFLQQQNRLVCRAAKLNVKEEALLEKVLHR